MVITSDVSLTNDYAARMGKYKPVRDTLETAFVKKACTKETETFFKLTADAFQLSKELTGIWIKKFQATPISNKSGTGFKRYWRKQNKTAGIVI